jgi:lactate permease
MDWLLSLLPVIAVLLLMLVFRWGAAAAGAVGWAVAALVAVLRFGAGGDVLAYAQLKGLFVSLYVIYIIWGAMLFYRVTYEAGVVAAIGSRVAALTAEPALRVLLLGWVFSSFLQGVGGLGVPVAVVAPLLVSVGFAPLVAVVVTTVGHTWAVTFGSLGASFHALIAATGRNGAELAPWSALLLGLACLACGAGALWAAGGRRMLKPGLAPLALIGATMAAVQYAAATTGLWAVASMLAGLAGLAVAVAWARRHGSARRTSKEDRALPRGMSTGWALAPYALLVLIVLAAQVGPIREFVDQVVLSAAFPELTTSSGFTTAASEGRAISVFGHTGALLTYASLLVFGLGRARGWYGDGAGRRILGSVCKQVSLSALGIVTLVGMAVTMEHAGMTQVLADGIVASAGQAFPFVAPLIGALGAFLSGSNTSSNLLFAPLQQEVATLVGVDPLLVLGAQTAGGAVGSAIAPAKLVVGCSTVAAPESGALRGAIRYILLVVAALALVSGLLASLPF